MEQKNLPPHVLIFPLPLQGPMNSTFKLAEFLAVSGLHVTVLVTEHIHARLVASTNNFLSYADSYPEFQFKIIPDGLPEDHPRTATKFKEVLDSLNSKFKPQFKEMLVSGILNSGTQRRPVTSIIADGGLTLTCDVARDIGIPIFYIRTFSACCLWVFMCFPRLVESGEIPYKGDDLDALIKCVPGTESFLRRRDLPKFSPLGNLADESLFVFFSRESQENPRADGIILNTFEELEEPIISHMRAICPNIYTIGPCHAHLKTKLSRETTMSSSSSLWEEDKSCIAWLDAQPLKSVIFVSFGSITSLTKDQLLELLYGIVNSGIKFLWVMRPDYFAGKDWKTLIPAELLEGTKQNGYVVGWAPQKEVLDHHAVGGFLTHSGWNSTLESIYAGVPMICWPYLADQQVNSRFVSEVWKIGLDMKDTCDRTIVKKMVRELMVEKKDEFSERADAWSKLAKRCLSQGGSSCYHLERLIKDIKSSVMTG